MLRQLPFRHFRLFVSSLGATHSTAAGPSTLHEGTHQQDAAACTPITESTVPKTPPTTATTAVRSSVSFLTDYTTEKAQLRWRKESRATRLSELASPRTGLAHSGTCVYSASSPTSSSASARPLLKRTMQAKNKVVVLHPEGSQVITLDLSIELPGEAARATPTLQPKPDICAVSKSMARQEREPASKTLDRIRLLFAPLRSNGQGSKRMPKEKILSDCPTVRALCRSSDLKEVVEEELALAAPGTTPVFLHSLGETALFTELNPELPNCVFWKHAQVLCVNETSVRVHYNVPTVVSIASPGIPYVGLPLACADVSLLFASKESLCYEWCVVTETAASTPSTNQGDVEFCVVGTAPTFTPTSELLGKQMLLRVSLDPGTGLWTEMRLPGVVSQLPPPVPRWQETTTPVNYPAFRVVTYNILYDDFCTSKSSKAKIYPFASDAVLNLENRKVRIVQELLAYHMDIVCLQECGRDVFQSYFLPVMRARGYDGVYCNKSGSVKEGCGFLFRESRFQLVQYASVPLNFQTLSSMFPELAARVGVCAELKEALSAVTSIGARVVLRELTSDKEMVVGNTHLFYHANACHIRVLQAYMFLHWLNDATLVSSGGDAAVSSSASLSGRAVQRRPLVICGDFNCTHPTATYRLLTTGQVEADHLSWEKGKLFWWGCARLLGCDADGIEERLGKDVEQSKAKVGPKDSKRQRKLPAEVAVPPTTVAAEAPAKASNAMQAQEDPAQDEVGERVIAKVFREALYGPQVRLQDAYQRTDASLPWTNFTLTFREVIDYIFFSEDSVEVLRTVPIPSEAELTENFALPNSKYPSDHIALVADLAFTTQSAPMQSVTEHRVLVYQCGARAVVNLSDIRRCSCISPSNLPSFESPTPFEGTRRDEVANIPSSTRATAGGKNALESLCSSLTMNMVTAPEGECCSDRAPSHTASSPSPRVPPPPPPTGCANLDAGDISSLLKNTGPQALSRHSAHHSVQGVSPSPLEDDVNCHGYSAALPENDHYSSWFAEWPPTALVTSSNSALLLRDQGSAEASLCCAAAGGVPPKWTSGVAVEDHETMNLFNQPRITPANTFPAGEVEAACLTGPPQGRTGECRCGVPPSHVGSRPSPLPQLPTSNIGSGITPISATGAERVLFDDDDFTDVSTPSARCHTLQPDLETAPAVPCAGADAVAHTPPRPCDIRRGALPASNCGGIGDCGSTGCNSRDPFLAHYTTTSLSSHTTPRTCVFSAEAAVGASGELLDAKPPSVCGHEKKDLTTKVTEESAEGSSPTAKDNLIEDTPCASTTFTWANGNLPAFKTPVISPLRQELLLRLLTTQAASAAYTPSVRTFSSGASPRNHGALGTPTPLHGSHGWRGASATSGGESLAEITGFPTPVKLSPIPTKGYSAHCEISASVTAATRGSTWTSATPASGLPSPTVFAGNGDAHECDAENPDLVTPAAAAHAIEAVEHVRASRRLTTGRSFSEGGRVGPLSHSSGPDSLSTAHSISSINSECSVSPICVRARQTTRVWSPHPSEVSQQQHPKPPLPSTEGHSSRSLTDFPSSSAVQHQPPQRQQSTVLCHSPVFGPVHAAPCDHTFSAHTNPCDTTVCPERAAAEVFEDLNAMSLMFTEVQAQPTHRQSHKLLHPVAGTGDLASLHNSTDRSAGERFTTRYAPDTVNLGTPTVSMIQSTGQALGESCCSLFMPPATQYIQALPIPGLQPRNPPSGQATQRSGLAVEGLGGESDTVGLANEARQNRRRQMQNAMLISPVLSDKEEENGIRCPTVGSCSTKRVLPRVQASPLVSSNDTSSMWERQPFAPKPEKNERDASAYLRTPFSTCFRSCEVEEEWGRHGCSVHSAPPCASSFAGQLKRPSCSRIAVTSPWENSHPHLRLPSRTDAPRHTEVPYVRYRPAFTASSQSATYFIDSWL